MIRQLIRSRHDIDLIHCHTIEGLAIALALRILTLRKIPICIDVHGPIVEELVHYGLIPDWRVLLAVIRSIEHLMLKSVQHVFVSNEGLKCLLAERVGAQRVSVVYDYVDPRMFSADHRDAEKIAGLRRQYQPNGERIVTYLGMFKDYQGVDYLLRAFAKLVKEHPNLRLLLVGDGPCRAQYEQIIRDANLGCHVALPGLVPHSDVANWLELSDLVVSPRVDNAITRAGFVSQLPEYMAAGKLIVATWVSGCRHLLRDGAGIVVEPNDVEALRTGMTHALAMNREQRLQCIAQARHNVAQFTWQQGIADVYDNYRKLLPRPEFRS